MYDYYLGGKTNFPADREAAEDVLRVFPQARTMARCNRAFIARAVTYVATMGQKRQFLDIGTGIPTSPSLHEVVRSVAPDARFVYVDNDPIVLVHTRALPTSRPRGATAYLNADLRDPEKILASPEVRDTFDLSLPVVLTMNAVLHFISDADDPYGIVATLLDGLPDGSLLIFTHATADFAPEQTGKAAAVYEAHGIPVRPRSRAEVERFVTGLDVAPPGLTVAHRWRPDKDRPKGRLTDADVSSYAAMARRYLDREPPTLFHLRSRLREDT
jgi:hypothetical protein